MIDLIYAGDLTPGQHFPVITETTTTQIINQTTLKIKAKSKDGRHVIIISNNRLGEAISLFIKKKKKIGSKSRVLVLTA